MLKFLETLKEQHSDDESLIAINQIENELTVRRHIVGGANRTLISVATPPRSCRIGTCRRLSAG